MNRVDIDERELLHKRYATGMLLEDIAHEYGCTTPTIHKRLREIGEERTQAFLRELDRREQDAEFAVVLLTLINASLKAQLEACKRAYERRFGEEWQG